MEQALKEGLLRDLHDQNCSMKIERTGAQQYSGDQLSKRTFYHICNLERTLTGDSFGRSTAEELLYSRSIQVKPKKFRNLRIFSDMKNDRLILQLSVPDEEIKEYG